MPTPFTPRAKAFIEGRDRKNPQRYRNRREPKQTASLGEPPEWMTKPQRASWRIFQREIPWLGASHRCLVEIACVVHARLTSGQDVGAGALNLLRQCLGQMGATPTSGITLDLAEPDDDILDAPPRCLAPHLKTRGVSRANTQSVFVP
ncbi:MAG: hypothetical protein J0H89_06185 [Rhizobiales bacterium]|nr:hypothetical protein [Hyphomicrobiales bacterium]